MNNHSIIKTLLPLFIALTLAACTGADDPAQPAASTPSITITSFLTDSPVTPEPTDDLTATASWTPPPTASPTPDLLVNWSLETIPPLPAGQPVALDEIQMIDDDNGWGVVAAEEYRIAKWTPEDALDETYHEMIEAYGLMPDLLNPQDRILRTRDGGRTWLEVTPPFLVEVAHDQNGNTYYDPYFIRATTFFLDAETAWVVYSYHNAISYGIGVSKEIWRTIDGGLTWEKGDLVSIGIGTLYWSSQDGCWTELDFTDHRYGWFKFECYLAMQNYDRLLYRTIDGGVTWELLGDDYDITIPDEVSFTNRDQGWGVRRVPGAYHSEFLRSHDSGRTWESQELLIPEVLQDYLNDSPIDLWGRCERAYSPELVAPQTGRLVLECDFNTLGTSYYLHISSNDGASWQSYLLPSDEVVFFNQNLGWALTEDEFGEEPTQLLQTQDGGRTWQPVSRLAWNGPFHFIDPQTGFALDYSADPTNLLRTADGGHTWQPLSPRLADVGLPQPRPAPPRVNLPDRETLSPLTPANLTRIEILDQHTAENATNLAALYPSFTEPIAVSYADGRLGLWDLDGTYPIIFSWHSDWVYDIAINPSRESGPDLLTASKDGTAKTYYHGGFEGAGITIEGHTGEFSAAALYGNLLATGSEDTTIKLWNLVKSGYQIEEGHTLQGHISWVWDVAFSPDGGLLASVSGDHTVRLWDVASGEELNLLEGHTSTVWRVAFSPDGSLLASASWDETIKLWDVATGQEVRTLNGHTNWLYALDFSPDGALIASGSADGTVRLWEIESGRELHQLSIDGTAVRGLAFTPDGKLLAAVSSGGKLVFWGVLP